MKEWARAAAVRAVKTAAQTAVGVIGAAAVMGDVQWAMVGSAAALAAVVSLLTSVAGMPEVEGGASVAKIAAKKEG
ncbi:holin [Paraeggerthella sp. Marseille-Q4926]|uniref:holin n=1 Tax=Paraeggerthella sp. Marseille-Q4926 TaxID=2866587 RepID=UPI001CE444B3|nr:holin [Paraeggerthella sp. Marseille-Q4926]